MTHSRYKQYLNEVQISHISLDWLCPISKTKLPICLRRFASGGFLLERLAFAILSPSPSFRLRHPFAFAIHQNGVFGGRTALSPSPSTKTAFLVDEPPFCLRHPPKRRFWWMGHGRSPSKSADLPFQEPEPGNTPRGCS